MPVQVSVRILQCYDLSDRAWTNLLCSSGHAWRRLASINDPILDVPTNVIGYDVFVLVNSGYFRRSYI
jgi:hypothetical protein